MKISILTATRNRKNYLEKIYNSLLNQEFTDFEWIIGDDNSSDSTEDYLKDIIEENKIIIKYLKFESHIGKAAIENVLIDESNGDYIISCDSGDFFTSNALIEISQTIAYYSINDDDSIISIIGLCVDDKCNKQTIITKKKEIYNHNEYYKYIKGDGCLVTKRKMITQRFPEVDFVVNESSLWRKLQINKKIIHVDKVWKIMIREIPNNISFSPIIRYTMGWAVAIAESETIEYFDLKNYYNKIELVINYYRYTIHSDIKFKHANEMWVILKIKKYYRMLYIFAKVLVYSDMIFKKIEKTYLEFNRNIKNKKYIIYESVK